MSNNGWIKLYRDIQNHWIWSDAQKLKWWLDILLMANHKDNKFLLGNELMRLERGEFHTSELKLAERWNTSKTTVRKFMELLKNDNMIEIKKSKKGTTIKVNNYNAYQSVSEEEKTIKKPQKNHKVYHVRTIKKPYGIPQKNHEVYTNKNVKNDKECKEHQECKKGPFMMDENISTIVSHYEKCFKQLVKPIQVEKLNSFIQDNMEIELILMIMEKSSSKDDPYAYTLKVLNNCIDKQVLTVKDYEIKQQEHVNKKNKGTPKGKFTNTYEHNWDFDELERKEQELINEKVNKIKNDREHANE